jgi:hypothetical protein
MGLWTISRLLLLLSAGDLLPAVLHALLRIAGDADSADASRTEWINAADTGADGRPAGSERFAFNNDRETGPCTRTSSPGRRDAT